MRDTHWSSQFHTVSCAEGPWWSREKGEKEGTTQKNGCGIRQVIMAPLPLHCLGTGRGGRRAENESEVQLQKKAEFREGVFDLALFLTVIFYFLLKLNRSSLSSVCFADVISE